METYELTEDEINLLIVFAIPLTAFCIVLLGEGIIKLIKWWKDNR